MRMWNSDSNSIPYSNTYKTTRILLKPLTSMIAGNSQQDLPAHPYFNSRAQLSPDHWNLLDGKLTFKRLANKYQVPLELAWFDNRALLLIWGWAVRSRAGRLKTGKIKANSRGKVSILFNVSLPSRMFPVVRWQSSFAVDIRMGFVTMCREVVPSHRTVSLWGTVQSLSQCHSPVEGSIIWGPSPASPNLIVPARRPNNPSVSQMVKWSVLRTSGHYIGKFSFKKFRFV